MAKTERTFEMNTLKKIDNKRLVKHYLSFAKNSAENIEIIEMLMDADKLPEPRYGSIHVFGDYEGNPEAIVKSLNEWVEAAHGKGLRRAIWLFCRSESGPVGWPGRSNENICFYDYPSPFATQRTRRLLLFSHAKECARRPNIQTRALAETPQ